MKRFTLFLLGFSIWWLCISRADVIHVSGEVSGTWSADTVIVNGEVRVAVGQTLVIVPGVRILFATYCKFIIRGNNTTLIADGTEEDSIYFDELIPFTNWHGIRFLDASPNSSLSYCDIAHGKATGSPLYDNSGGGIYVENTDLSISHLTVRNCQAYAASAYEVSLGGGILCREADLELQSSSFFNCSATNGGAIAGVDNSEVTISECALDSNWVGNYETYGGGIYGQNSHLSIVSNEIINNIADGFWDNYGGGIYLEDCDAEITGNAICGNFAIGWGSGICCSNSSVTFEVNFISGNGFLNSCLGGGIFFEQNQGLAKQNVITNNQASEGGGIKTGINSSLTLINNIIQGNSSGFGGGVMGAGDITGNILIGNIIDGNSASLSIGGLSDVDSLVGNIISNNTCEQTGGGLKCSNNSPPIFNNCFIGNAAGGDGGGVLLQLYSSPLMKYNAFISNTCGDGTSGEGSAIYCDNMCSPDIISNTIVNNIAPPGGAAVHCHNSSFPDIRNCIIFNNSGGQIGTSGAANPTVEYCDVQDGWPGTGNINAYPAFLDTTYNEFRLLWGSPCINSGDPDPIYNDPDSTRADMGAFYYDQSMPVRISLIPHNIPEIISETGGTIDFTIRIDNIDATAHTVTVWCDITLPDSGTFGPVLGPVHFTIGAGITVSRVRTQNIPAPAPMGIYHYNAYAVVGTDTCKDNFLWGKIATFEGLRNSGLRMTEAGWENYGEPITDLDAPDKLTTQPSKFTLYPPSPNPFNEKTVISFQLPDASWVELAVFDVQGQEVQSLVNGQWSSGKHSVTWNAEGMASGVYFVRLKAGEFSQTQKMVLMK